MFSFAVFLLQILLTYLQVYFPSLLSPLSNIMISQNQKIVNEIVLRTMKSSLCSDEIFGVPPQMKLNPPHSSPREAGFHREAISSTKGGFLPPAADLTEKSRLLTQSAFFLCCHYKIDPYKATVQK